MRVAFSVRRGFSASRASTLSPRGAFIESSLESSSKEASSGCSLLLGAQLQQERTFSAPMFRPRGPSSAWSLQHDRQTTAGLTSSTSSLAAIAAWQASVISQESSQVEDWLAALHQVDAEARSLCSGLLSRHPTLLWKDAARTTGVVQALLDATRQRQLLRPYFMQDTHILALVDRYTPEGLRARLSELHRLVWQKLDDSNVASLFASRTSLDMLDLDAKALALKAQALRALIPEFLPSTVLRGCPELLDVQVDDLVNQVHRAGDVVVVGEHVVSVELVAANNVVIVRSNVPTIPPSPAAGSDPAASATAPAATAGRLLRTARCGAQQLLHEQARAASFSTREMVRVFCNSRQLVYAGGGTTEVRVEDPDKAQEDLSAACRMAVLQRLSIAGQATAGVRCA